MVPFWLDIRITTALGRPRCGTAVTHTFHRLLAEAGVSQRTFHTLRHSAATLMLAGGADLKTVWTALGLALAPEFGTRLKGDLWAILLLPPTRPVLVVHRVIDREGCIELLAATEG